MRDVLLCVYSLKIFLLNLDNTKQLTLYVFQSKIYNVILCDFHLALNKKQPNWLNDNLFEADCHNIGNC